jgi:hypothetical protein
VVSSVIRKIRQNDHYEVNLQNSRVPNSIVSEKLIPSMILGASEEELSVKTKKDPRPKRHQEKRPQVLRVKRKNEEQLKFFRRQKFTLE